MMQPPGRRSGRAAGFVLVEAGLMLLNAPLASIAPTLRRGLALNSLLIVVRPPTPVPRKLEHNIPMNRRRPHVGVPL